MSYAALTEELLEAMSELHADSKRGRHPMNRPGGELFLLQFIANDSGESISPSELAAMCGFSTAHVAITLKKLEGRGFIVRETDKEDRRRTSVTITEAGLAVHLGRMREHRCRTERMLSELGEEDAREYVRLVRRTVAITRKIMREDHEARQQAEHESEN